MDAGAKDLPVDFFGAPLPSAPVPPFQASAARRSRRRRASSRSAATLICTRRSATAAAGGRLAGHQPRAQVARKREQLPRLHGGELRHHRFERERVEAPARGLLQQGAEPVQRVPRQSRATCGQRPGAAEPTPSGCASASEMPRCCR